MIKKNTQQTNRINVRGNGELIENELKSDNETNNELNKQFNRFGLSGSSNDNDEDDLPVTHAAKQFLMLLIVLYKRKLEESEQRNINSKQFDELCQQALQSGALYGLRHDLIYNRELIPESIQFTEAIYQSICHFLLQMLQYFDEQVTLLFFFLSFLCLCSRNCLL